MSRAKTLISAAVTLAALSLSSCTSLRPELEEVQTLRAELESSWNQVDEVVAGVERDVETFVLQSIPTGAAEVSIVNAGGSIETVAPQDASAEARAWAETFEQTANNIASRLQEQLPEAIRETADKASDAPAQIAKLRASAEAKVAASEENPLMKSGKESLQADYAAFLAECERIENLAGEVTVETPQIQARLTEALEEFNAKLSVVQNPG